VLITNFSAGELSENLFGRIDMPQYYQGVSHLENFDVIPTGGIRRRPGMQRLTEVEKEGRLIPFIINAEERYLVAMYPSEETTDFRIYEIYKEENLEFVKEVPLINEIDGGTIIEDDHTIEAEPEEIDFVKTLKEINEVKYAHNNRRMILCHGSYQPVIIIYGSEIIQNEETDSGEIRNIFRIKMFDIKYSVEVFTDGFVNNNYNAEKDSVYSENKYLISPNNYPRMACFFNNRLVFAGTYRDPQRIFASRVGDIEDFSTHRKYVTEKRDYILIQGTINVNKSNIITVNGAIDILQFKNPLQNYFIEHGFYEEGTTIKSIEGHDITLSNDLKPLGITIDMIKDCKSWMDEIYKQDKWSGSYLIGTIRESVIRNGPRITEINRKYYLQFGIGKKAGSVHYYFERITIRDYGGGGTSIETITIRVFQIKKDEIEKCITDKDYLNSYIKTSLNLGSGYTLTGYSNFIDAFFELIYHREDNDLNILSYIINADLISYGTPQDIYDEINIYSGDSYYFPFYLKEEIFDSAVVSDDGFTFEIASDMGDSIEWLALNKNLLIGTSTAEWIIPSNITASNIQVYLNSRYGSDNIQATTIGDAVVFLQTGKKAAIEYYIPQQDNNFRANNMAHLSKNMLHESRAMNMDFISAPYTRIFIVREKGDMVSLLYDRGTGTFAWERITTPGEIKCVATIPGDSGFDEVYLLVGRRGKYYLECFNESSPVYLDGYFEIEKDTQIQEGMNECKEVNSRRFIGLPYVSRVRSMPIIVNPEGKGVMKQNIIKSLSIRFNKSYLPLIRSLVGDGREVKTDTITHEEPYSGIIEITFPGQFDRDVFFEFEHSKSTEVEILSVNAEAN